MNEARRATKTFGRKLMLELDHDFESSSMLGLNVRSTGAWDKLRSLAK